MFFIQLKSRILTLMSVLITFTIHPLKASAELQNENYSIYNTHRECSGMVLSGRRILDTFSIKIFLMFS